MDLTPSTSSPNNGKEENKKKERKEKKEKLEARKRVKPENALVDTEVEETNKKNKQDRKSKKVKGKDPERHDTKNNIQAQMEKDESDIQKEQGKEILKGISEVDPGSSPVEDRKERKKKRKRKEQEVKKEEEDSMQAVAAEGESEPKKKRKRNEQEVKEEEEDSMQAAATEGESEPKKRSKNKTGFPDPDEEALLSGQARKALGYAFSQFRKPSKWKFHKARQNWIVRNVWSIENVPDSQMPLVLKYLSNVQGNTRENLIKSCESVIAEAAIPSTLPTPAVEQGAAEQTAGNDTQQPANSIKALRAQALLSVLKGDVQV